MKYAYTIFYVADVESSLQFYQKAFGFEQKMLTPEKDYGELNSGETTLSFASLDLGKSNLKNGFSPLQSLKSPAGMELAFVTDEIEQDFHRAVAAGAKLVEPILQKPWGQKVGYLQDPNGILIELCTPIGG